MLLFCSAKKFNICYTFWYLVSVCCPQVVQCLEEKNVLHNVNKTFLSSPLDSGVDFNKMTEQSNFSLCSNINHSQLKCLPDYQPMTLPGITSIIVALIMYVWHTALCYLEHQNQHGCFSCHKQHMDTNTCNPPVSYTKYARNALKRLSYIMDYKICQLFNTIHTHSKLRHFLLYMSILKISINLFLNNRETLMSIYFLFLCLLYIRTSECRRVSSHVYSWLVSITW